MNVLVSGFHFLDFMNTQSLHCVLFYKPGCRTRGVSKEKTILARGTQRVATESPRAHGWCWAQWVWWELHGQHHGWVEELFFRGQEFCSSCTAPNTGNSDSAPTAELFLFVTCCCLYPHVCQEGSSCLGVFQSNPLGKGIISECDRSTGFLFSCVKRMCDTYHSEGMVHLNLPMRHF